MDKRFLTFFAVGITLGFGVLVTSRQDTGTGTVVHLPMEEAGRICLQPDRADRIRPQVLRHYTTAAPANAHPILTWSRIDGAVMYTLQILEKHEDPEGGVYYERIMPLQTAYTNAYELALPADFSEREFYWRVRGADLEGRPVSSYSEPEETPVDLFGPFLEKPQPLSFYNSGNGTVLLYPVYDWIAVPAAVEYEVEILDEAPENPNGIEPSVHRVDAYYPRVAEQYDQRPRFGPKPFYWRVRALDKDGNPLGVYSDAVPFVTDPGAHYVVATLGDSISHGGGSVSYSPTDWEFSYQHYLNFPTLNVSESGDTSAMTVARFDRDVLPFAPQYVLIMMGSNSLRGGVAAETVIADMEAVKAKCLDNGIRPVFLTLPPFNPANIDKAFQQPTVSDWQYQVDKVNDYIRGQVHIDITPGLADEEGVLRGDLAVDGLHLDPPGKKLIAQAINRQWPEILALPAEAWQ